MSRSRWFVYVIWGLTAGILIVQALARAEGLWWNATASLPRGLWRVVDRPVERGSVVLVCPPDKPIFRAARSAGAVPPGICPGDYTPLLKPVVALAGDQVEVTPEGVLVNGKPLRNSQPMQLSLAGERHGSFPPGRYEVRAGETWVVSQFNDRSFDSRYYGPLKLDAILGVAEPVWIFH